MSFQEAIGPILPQSYCFLLILSLNQIFHHIPHMPAPWWSSLIIHLVDPAYNHFLLLLVEVLLGRMCLCMKFGSLMPVISKSFVIKTMNTSNSQNFEVGIRFKQFASFFDFGLMLGFRIAHFVCLSGVWLLRKSILHFSFALHYVFTVASITGTRNNPVNDVTRVFAPSMGQ